jgi:nicotinamidase-related amidase
LVAKPTCACHLGKSNRLNSDEHAGNFGTKSDHCPRRFRVGEELSVSLVHFTADTLPAIAPKGNEPVVVASVDKFILGDKDTGLEKMLKDKGITSVIAVGTAAHGAVLYTSSAAALRGFNVIVPVDGMSGDGQNTYVEQYVAYNLTSAPGGVAAKTTLTRIDMIKFAN